MNYTKTADMVLRAGLAFSFLYPPVNALSYSDAWVGYIPSFMGFLGNPVTLLHVFGIVEIGIALWILLGKSIWLPATLAACILVGIVAFNMPEFQVLFRDLSIAALALALAIIHRPATNLYEPR